MMGVDGSGVFDNDSCADFLSEICQRLREAIQNDLSTLDNGFLERVSPAAISVLLAIAKHIPVSRCFTDNKEIVAYRDQYLRWFDANMPEFEAEENFLKEWRSVAEQEFNALIALCAQK